MLPDYSIPQWVFGATILFSAYFVRGVTGFGSGLIAIPMLSVVFPVHIVIPLVVILDYLGSTGLVTFDLYQLLVVSIPVMVVSVFIGGLLHRRLRNWNIKRDIRILSMAGGTALIIKSFLMP